MISFLKKNLRKEGCKYCKSRELQLGEKVEAWGQVLMVEETKCTSAWYQKFLTVFSIYLK
jgi:hypothetical protein